MAGKKNHIIPKWLQNGFASRVNGENVFTWVYRKNSEPFETNIGNSIAENYFFGKKGELNADDEMTDVETYKLSPLMNKLRDGSLGFENSRSQIAELIAHFSIRTKTIRKGFEEMSKKTLEGIGKVLTDDEISSDLLSKASEKEIAEIFDEALNISSPEMDSALATFQIFGLGKENVKDLTTDLTLSNQQNEETQSLVKELFSDIFEGMIQNLPESVKKGHNKSLLENTIPLPRVEKYEQLNWSIYEVTSLLILGDVACVFRELGEKSFKSSCDIDKTGQIYLPISYNQILVGTIDTEEVETDVKVLNEAMARCSYEQFVCSEKSDEKIDLIESIGIDSYIASDEEITREINEIRNNFGRMYEDK